MNVGTDLSLKIEGAIRLGAHCRGRRPVNRIGLHIRTAQLTDQAASEVWSMYLEVDTHHGFFSSTALIKFPFVVEPTLFQVWCLKWAREEMR